jgi:hypothetical protein
VAAARLVKAGLRFTHRLAGRHFFLGLSTLLQAVHGPKTWHEFRMFAFLRRWMRRGDILVVDRGSDPISILLLPSRGVDLIVRIKYAAKIVWRKGRKLGVLTALPQCANPERLAQW